MREGDKHSLFSKIAIFNSVIKQKRRYVGPYS